jgi:drug/metabolite transporter (DMT)-like permease
MRPTTKALLELHFCVLLWGFTSILGKLITLPALALVEWRMLLVVAAVLAVPRVWRGLYRLSPRLVLVYAGIGVVLTVHWLTFYGAIKLANASIAATCLALGPVFLALVEPVVARRPFDPREVALGVAVVPGVALVVGGIPSGMRVGVSIGALSAFCVAVFGVLNKRFVREADPLTITCVELGAGSIVLAILGPLWPHSGPSFPLPGPRDAVLLVILATVCTLLPFALALKALRHLSAFAAQLVVNLEPVYSIVLAVLLLGEHHTLGGAFYLGVSVILGVVFLAPLRRAA